MGERLTDEALRALVAATHPGVLVDGRAAVDGSGRCLECGEHLGHDPGYVWHAPTCRLEAMECEAAAVMPALRDAAPDLGREVLELRARCADLERRLAATRHYGPEIVEDSCPVCGGDGRSSIARERDEARAEVERLRAELAKPVAGPWARFGGGYSCRLAAVRDGSAAAECGRDGGEGPRVWLVRDPVTQRVIASGPETGKTGERLADAAAAAAWRLL